MEEICMNLKRVLSFAMLVALVATTAYAQGGLGFDINTLNLGPVAAPTSKLNVENTSGIIRTAPDYAGVTQYLLAAYDGGMWDGNGLTSAVAQAHGYGGTGDVLYSLGTMTGTDYIGYYGTSFYTATVASANTVVKFTYSGDADLNGVINADDQYYLGVTIDALNDGGSPTINWFAGDFDYNGIVNADDQYWQGVVIDYANDYWSGATPPLSGSGITPVPEPATMILLFLALAGFVGYRKIRN
jgi:hypothetical protein